MSLRPNKPCKKPGCRELTREGYCSVHAPLARGYDRNRGSSAKRGYGRLWRRERAAFLLENPLCVACYRNDRVTASSVVDHVVPHKGDQKLFWDRSNWQALCKPCHDAKTAREDGGFGNG
ncbi:HNH endonuclease [Paenibacillus sp. FSL W8-0194]|uniref:HNH endonuclease n=1 Tax=Paenibacillus sp. FSL W8-0194 TaxID=2921711 RepID=UPI0030DCE2A3